MPIVFIALLATLSSSVWIYSKAMRQTGNNTQKSLTVAGVVGLIIFIVLFTVLNIVFPD